MLYDHPLIGWAYRKSPHSLQNAMVSGYGLLQRWERKSAIFRRMLAELRESERWTASDLESLQAERLRVLICHAYENVPYYRRIFEERRLKPADIATVDDLYKLPVLTKPTVRRFFDELRARNVPRHRIRISQTGGSTGIPLKLILDRDRILFDHALVQRHWSWAGYRSGDLTVVIRGLTLISPSEVKAYWRRDWVENKNYLSGFHLSTRTIPVYLQKLTEWKPKFIVAYPSNLFALARFMQSEGLRIPLKAIFTSSEALSELERRVIEERFLCKVWDRYGTGERLVVTQQCEHGNYHQNVEFGILQVDSPLGCPALAGSKGSLILTSLTNFAMPFIRFSIEDVGSLIDGQCPCGRQLRLAGAVDGRKDDVIVTAEGCLMPRAGLDQIHEYVQNIERCQLVQKKIGEVTVRIQPRPSFTATDSAEIIRQLRNRLGSGTTIHVELVDKLELTVSGKHRFIVSELDIEALTGLNVEVPAR